VFSWFCVVWLGTSVFLGFVNFVFSWVVSLCILGFDFRCVWFSVAQGYGGLGVLVFLAFRVFGFCLRYAWYFGDFGVFFVFSGVWGWYNTGFL